MRASAYALPAGMPRSDFEYRLDRVRTRTSRKATAPTRDADGSIVGRKRNVYSFPPVGTPDGWRLFTAGDRDRFLRRGQAELAAFDLLRRIS